MIVWVDKELEAWGRAMKGSAAQLGFARESLEYRMMKYGPDSLIKDCKAIAPPDTYLPDQIIKTELVVLAMPADLKTLAIVVYTMPDHNRDTQAKVLSKRLGESISRRKLLAMLDNLHHRYDMYTTAMNSCDKKYFKFMEKAVDSVPPKSV